MSKLHLILILVIFVTITNYTLAKERTNLILRTDNSLFEKIYDEPPQINGLDNIMKSFNKCGDIKVILGATLFLSAFGDIHARETGKLATSAIIGTGMTIYCLKHTVRRQRPLKEEPEETSFPSGHSGFSYTLAYVIGHQYPRWRIPLYFVATMVGTSRIYLGRHYPLDVLGGALIGVLVGWQVTNHKDTILEWEF